MIKYTMTPIDNGTRLRSDHNTFSTQIDINPSVSGVQSFNKDDLLIGDELWIASTDAPEVKKGDKWLRITHRNGVELVTKGWTAYIHKGLPICDNFTEIPDVDPEPTPTFPSSFILTEPNGAKAEYILSRIITELQ